MARFAYIASLHLNILVSEVLLIPSSFFEALDTILAENPMLFGHRTNHCNETNETNHKAIKKDWGCVSCEMIQRPFFHLSLKLLLLHIISD